jgi:hypothetical protein
LRTRARNLRLGGAVSVPSTTSAASEMLPVCDRVAGPAVDEPAPTHAETQTAAAATVLAARTLLGTRGMVALDAGAAENPAAAQD